MPVIKGQEWTFNTQAELYEKMRPGYPKELYDDLFRQIRIDRSSSVVEIGIGGGQATKPVLDTGCKLTCAVPNSGTIPSFLSSPPDLRIVHGKAIPVISSSPPLPFTGFPKKSDTQKCMIC